MKACEPITAHSVLKTQPSVNAAVPPSTNWIRREHLADVLAVAAVAAFSCSFPALVFTSQLWSVRNVLTVGGR